VPISRFLVSVLVWHGVSITSGSVDFARKSPAPLPRWISPVLGERERSRSGAPEQAMFLPHIARRGNPFEGPKEEKWAEVCRLSARHPYYPRRISEDAV
jgi:hypothetical protein